MLSAGFTIPELPIWSNTDIVRSPALMQYLHRFHQDTLLNTYKNKSQRKDESFRYCVGEGFP